MLAMIQLVNSAGNQLVDRVMVLSITDFFSALAEMITGLVMTLAEWVISLLTGGSPFSLFVVVTLIVLILGKLRGNDRY